MNKKPLSDIKNAIDQYIDGEHLNIEILTIDDCDDAIIGIGNQYTKHPLVIYDYDKLIEVFAKKFINTFKNKKFSTEDFLHLNIGGYIFEWVITNMEYRDYDFYLYGKTSPGGSVTLIDGRHLTLDEALNSNDFGWQIQEEVNEVVQDCMNEIILPVTGYDVTVPLVTIY